MSLELPDVSEQRVVTAFLTANLQTFYGKYFQKRLVQS